MNVTIIGTGNMARGIGTRLVVGGNAVTLVGREPEATAALAAELNQAAAKNGSAKAVSFGSPISDSVVILALPYPAVSEVVQHYYSQLGGKIVVDITNILNPTYDDVGTPPGSSGAEEIARLLPADAHLIKAFNTTFATPLVAGEVAGQPLDVLMAGDDAESKKVLAGLIEAGKMRPIDAGPLKRARQLEGIGLLHITLQFTLNTSFRTAWKLLQ